MQQSVFVLPWDISDPANKWLILDIDEKTTDNWSSLLGLIVAINPRRISLSWWRRDEDGWWALTSEHKAADCGNEAAEEGVEREGADEAAVHELDDGSQEHVQEVRVDDFQLLGSFRCVLLIQFRNDGSYRSHFCVLNCYRKFNARRFFFFCQFLTMT